MTLETKVIEQQRSLARLGLSSRCMTLNIQALHSQSDKLDAAQMSNKPTFYII